MRTLLKATIIAVFTIMLCCPSLYAWDVSYQASSGVLPTGATPAWMLSPPGSTMISVVSDGILHMQHSSTDLPGYYTREQMTIGAGIPITLETRMRVTEASNNAPGITIQTGSIFVGLYIYPDHIVNNGMSFSGDFSTFRTIRLACDAQGNVYTWVDGQLALSYYQSTSGGGQNGIAFGSNYREGSFDSYWQYVAYSKAFVPVPEPSSLLALSCPILGLAGAVIKRKRGSNR